MITVRLTAILIAGCMSIGLIAQQVPYPDYLKNKVMNRSGCMGTDVRSIDGTCNNLTNMNYGMAGSTFERISGAYYVGDGHTMVADRPSARAVSNILCHQNTDKESTKKFTGLLFTFMQFIDHDITATVESHNEAANIPVPAGDPSFDPANTGTQVIPFSRSFVVSGTGTSNTNPDQHLNAITAWLDGSAVYGSDENRANWLRTFNQGKLKVSPSSLGDMLPCNTIDGNCQSAVDPSAPFMAMNKDHCGNDVKVFVAGDIRANEQPALTAMHTLFVREHNRICDELVAIGMSDDELIYQEARRRVAGIMQSIMYHEVLPLIGIELPAYQYDPTANPTILEEFAQAGYRLGHTMVSSTMQFRNKDGQSIQILSGSYAATGGLFDGSTCMNQSPEPTMKSGNLPLRDAFFNPALIANNGIDNLFNGLKYQMQEEVDPFIVDDIRNFLFGAPGQGGLDLAAFNIQRGRDHGLPDYNTLRSLVGLQPYSSFSEISNSTDFNADLETTYGDINKIDPWVGMVAEKYLSGKNIGETLYTLLTRQFLAIRNGDRFYYENDASLAANIKQDITNTKLEDIIMRNTDNVISMDRAFIADDLPECNCSY